VSRESLIVLLLASNAACATVRGASSWAPAQPSAAIKGQLVDVDAGAPARAAIAVMCTCLPDILIVRTDATGTFQVLRLPPGTYTVRAFHGQADVTKLVTLGVGETHRVDFELDPRDPTPKVIGVPRRSQREPGRTLKVE
jgi:hypothetical protein